MHNQARYEGRGSDDLEESPVYQEIEGDQGSNDDDLLSNILPSYHMFQSTISKALTPTHENFTDKPPNYEVAPVRSQSSLLQSPDCTPLNTISNDEFVLSEQYRNRVIEEESVDTWENTILANVHKLPNLSLLSNPVSQNLEIDIKITEKVCQKGVEPTFIDPSGTEYKQGDYIHGYATLRNTSNEPIRFDMIYVLFEGTLTVLESTRGIIDPSTPRIIHKFLNMTDLFASWSYANIDRLATDNGYPHDWCYNETDPYDGTTLAIDVNRFLQPGVTYKRYFSFKIPEKLLDNICSPHEFPLHLNIPPTIGQPRNVQLPKSIRGSKETRIKDFSFLDTSVQYGVNVKIIGKSSDFKYASREDRYILAKECSYPIRVVPTSHVQRMMLDNYNESDIRLFYKAFVDAVHSKLEVGRALANTSSTGSRRPELTPTLSRDESGLKLKLLYQTANGEISKSIKNKKELADDYYQYMAPLKKKFLAGPSKVYGFISLSSPKRTYFASYQSPPKYRRLRPHDSATSLDVPFELSFFYSKASKKDIKFPLVKHVTAELVVFTSRSNKYPIPLEISHEMCFKDHEVESKNTVQNFDSIIVAPFQNYYQELRALLKKVGTDVFRIENQLFQDVLCLGTLATKYINLSFQKLRISSKAGDPSPQDLSAIRWEIDPDCHPDYSLFSKKFTLHLDLKDCALKGQKVSYTNCFDYMTLVPSFQNCYMARLYYLKVSCHLSSGEISTVNVPVTIEH